MERKRTPPVNLCSDKHDEVCYNQHSCPVCVLVGEIAELELRNQELAEEYQALELEFEKFDLDFVQWSNIKRKLEGPTH